MAKSSRQKLKLLYLRQILLDKTDDEHLLTIQEMIDELASYDIPAERKSVYDDLETLRMFGMDIEKVKGRSCQYHVLNRTFQLPELKLLVDGVQTSKFITHKKSHELIKKLAGFASVYEAQQMQRQTYVANRVKSMNESIYYNVDLLHNAIATDRQVRFKYSHYTIDKKLQFKKDGADYQVSPFALTFDNENYYLVAYDAVAGIIKHYRVDKMSVLNLALEPRQGQAQFAAFDMAVYEKKLFGMFTGPEQPVKMRFSNELIGVVIDRFGADVTVIQSEDEHFTVTVKVILSPQFYGWLFGLGVGAQLLGPELAVTEMKQLLQKVNQAY